MSAIFSANLILMVTGAVILLSGVYLMLGLAGSSNLIKRWLGGFLGLTGFAIYLLTAVPTCF